MRRLTASIEELLVEWLPSQVDAIILTDLDPMAEQSELPYIQVARIGGGRDLVLDRPMTDFDFYAPTRKEATDLALAVDDLLHYELPTQVAGLVLSLDGKYAGPYWRPYANTALVRMGATYGLLVH